MREIVKNTLSSESATPIIYMVHRVDHRLYDEGVGEAVSVTTVDTVIG